MITAPIPAKGSTDWYDHYKDIDATLSALPGVLLDTCPGSSDDDKLTWALNYIKSQDIKSPLLFGNRVYTFSQGGRGMFSGLRLISGFGSGDQKTAADETPNLLKYTGSGAWWELEAMSGKNETRGIQIEGLFFEGGASSQFLTGGSVVMWKAIIRNVGFNLWKHVLGSPSEKLLMNLCLFEGWWNVNNGRDTAFTIGGSDCNLWLSGCNLDSPTSLSKAGSWHLICSYLEKTHIGPMYITAEGDVGGILVQGSSGASGLVFTGQGRVEGRNAGAPQKGSLVRIEGGGVTFKNWSVNYAMSAPGSGDLGAITQTGGDVSYSNIWYDRASGVAESVPFIAQSGGVARVSNLRVGGKGGGWVNNPGRPIVKSTGGIINPTSFTITN